MKKINQPKIKVIESENIADIKIEIIAYSLDQLFNCCIKAFNQVLTEKIINDKEEKKELIITGKNLDELVFNFFDWLIFTKDVNHFLVKKVKIKKRLKKEIIFEVVYQKITKKIKIKADIKALTHHKFKVKKIKNYYFISLVFDL